jgi:endonuclease/exonuclease/phosphatase family metal-dependent hydrolase
MSADGEPIGPDTPADAAVYEPPRDDVVPAVGGESTIDIATWNIENFPRTPSTPSRIADLITSLDLDLVAVEEIADVAAFEEVVARLPHHAGILSSHAYGDGTYQKVGFIYKEGLIAIEGGTLLFRDQGLDFPRPPLSVQATVDGKVFTAIVLHLKAGVAGEDQARRTGALVTLEAHLRTIEDGRDPDVIVLGDYNQGREDAGDDRAWAPILSAPDRHTLLTEAAADRGEVSYLPHGGRLIDHAVVNAGFELGAAEVVVPRLDREGIDYQRDISDHLPVVVRFPR